MKKTLIVVDMQNDFIDGSLGTKEAQAIVEEVKKKIELYQKNGDEIIFTRDTHTEDYLNTNEGKHLPVEHCIAGTEGWRIAD
ncbi:MAG: isochorismatase family protein, partial [Lachnospiraceae bacterium]|nr:isochorismatase family protein [Lachnospiraceae bacterium]